MKLLKARTVDTQLAVATDGKCPQILHHINVFFQTLTILPYSIITDAQVVNLSITIRTNGVMKRTNLNEHVYVSSELHVGHASGWLIGPQSEITSEFMRTTRTWVSAPGSTPIGYNIMYASYGSRRGLRLTRIAQSSSRQE